RLRRRESPLRHRPRRPRAVDAGLGRHRPHSRTRGRARGGLRGAAAPAPTLALRTRRMTDDLTENYKRAFGRRVGFGARPALVLIDLCRAYYDAECDLYMGSDAS